MKSMCNFNKANSFIKGVVLCTFWKDSPGRFWSRSVQHLFLFNQTFAFEVLFSVGNTNHVVLTLLAALISHNWITVKLTLGYTRELIPQVSLNWVKSFPATFNNRSINSHRYGQLSLEWWHNYCGYWPKCKIHNFYRTCGSVTCSTFCRTNTSFS